ncbi:hypothetical protein [Actinoallomurus iriomotensis]|jgi:hypothetical protein|uniref:Uncharacterized protein n=1 Tax=Actinoallomurus iriomotensis TaxID=478107 RepID=A0A9W6RNX5_9ACTN|nr:hypothetical protein [Actinoallomurus iriomotensis]GLY77472.1 hypothetical protein Airi01_057390 [Actinoallomurus iriomotensis]
MTIVISIPGDLAAVMRALFPLLEPIALAIAGACGAGVLTQFGLDLGFRLARRALRV